MSNIWFTSDTHAYHKNICRGSTSWAEEPDKGTHSVQRTRPFRDQYEMTEQLIENINKYVKQDDTLWHLGDWSFGGIDSIWKFRKRINCKHIHLVYGNHDEHIERNKMLEIDEATVYQALTGNNIEGNLAYAQDLFESCQYYKELHINGRRIILSHYAFRVWNKSHHGSWHLYGHSHGTIDEKPYGKSMDVGVDTHPEFRPYSLAEIQKIIEKRDVLLVDHHNKNTN